MKNIAWRRKNLIKIMTLLTEIEKRPQFYELCFLVVYMFINNTINATSILMEAGREKQELEFPLWQPFVLEYTSALSFVLLMPLLLLFLKKVPLTWLHLKKNIIWHLLASVVFSLMHVALMVFFRKLVFISQQMHYQFGELPLELLYEYRKDAWAYIFFVMVIYCFRFIVSRLIGEAHLVPDGEAESESTPKEQECDRLLVKKLGKEFIIKVEDIDWLESCGNYVNLHVKERIYPLRATLGGLIGQISDKGFCRIHRSHGVNLDAVDAITPQPSGDCQVLLKNGKQLNLSRRYRDEFKHRLS